MRIAVIAHIRFPIAKPFKGGMEAHTYSLVKALQARGHDVDLYAAGDSDKTLPLIASLPAHYETIKSWKEWHKQESFGPFQEGVFNGIMHKILAGGYDVIHNNSLHPIPIQTAVQAGMPIVTSLHIPPFQKLRDPIMQHKAPFCLYSATSQCHWNMWELDTAMGCVVANSVSMDGEGEGVGAVQNGNGRAIWAGRITPNKGLAYAIDAAKAANIGLDIYGIQEDKTYFDEQIAPRLTPQHCYHGLVDSERLLAHMGQASVLLFTPMWEEPFGLVAIEALSRGTPIAGFDSGAATEVVQAYGIMVKAGDVAALARAIPQALTIDRQQAADFIRQTYPVSRMIEGYERLYATARTGLKTTLDVA